MWWGGGHAGQAGRCRGEGLLGTEGGRGDEYLDDHHERRRHVFQCRLHCKAETVVKGELQHGRVGVGRAWVSRPDPTCQQALVLGVFRLMHGGDDACNQCYDRVVKVGALVVRLPGHCTSAGTAPERKDLLLSSYTL